ncbi:MAG: branched-chain-amino-acid transaminase [Candidatus Schekmanbacteria bacterium RBG_13_48_7]|uniref:Branched-chain-amino-acid aminotransferase n=1 Tax=Candidatus Schekmanbacteria bacterium RBG_13_48_7 TaxID=1817878 RepID=A0A1F7S6P4_9BACT|nr:MAG: branched-chain-amino-acid transaminase [Candidatus Schekmanbacteria bacterium RBG_13_48_7]
MGEIIYVDGEFFTDRKYAKVSVFDHGYLYGDGVFEGIRVYSGNIFRCKEHIKRLYNSAKYIMMKIPMQEQELTEILVETVRRSELRDAYIRLVISRGIGDLGLDPRKCGKATVVIICSGIQLYPEEKYRNGLSVITCSTRRNRPDTINAQTKSLNYINNILGRIEVNLSGADEGIMLTDQGYVSEATADNIFVVKNGELLTPPSHMGILEGITRGAVMDLALELGIPMKEKAILIHDVYCAEECFLTGSGAELIPVVKADGRVIGDGKPGKYFWKLLDRFREITKEQGVQVYQ